jgi:hypothetical protein
MCDDKMNSLTVPMYAGERLSRNTRRQASVHTCVLFRQKAGNGQKIAEDTCASVQMRQQRSAIAFAVVFPLANRGEELEFNSSFQRLECA